MTYASPSSTFSDVAMLLRDPYALNAVCRSVLQCLLHLYEQNKLPRVSNSRDNMCQLHLPSSPSPPPSSPLPSSQECSDLESLLRLLQLGLKALFLVETKEYQEDRLVSCSCAYYGHYATMNVLLSHERGCETVKKFSNDKALNFFGALCKKAFVSFRTGQKSMCVEWKQWMHENVI